MTHVVGLRPFGSQLLCEQVVGRALRRTSYAVDPKTGLFTEGSANAFYRRMPPLSELEMEEAILAAARIALRGGITSALFHA